MRRGRVLMIFITVGSQKFQFDRLLRAVDELAGAGVITDSIFAQTGWSTYRPEHMEWRDFLNRDEFSDRMERCDIVITHGGTGVIVGALRRQKRVIGMPRLARFGEHVDDHQVQILEEFASSGLISHASDESDLARAYLEAKERVSAPYVSNNARFLSDLNGYLLSIEEEK